MGYATVGDVGPLNALRTFSGTSRPSATQVADFCRETSAVLDGLLAGQGYALPVPVTATSALEVLRHYNAVGAWFYAEVSAEASDQVETAQRAWERAQQMLRDGLVELPGVGRDTTTNGARGAFPATAMFTRDMQW